jgi:hypothetical protein
VASSEGHAVIRHQAYLGLVSSPSVVAVVAGASAVSGGLVVARSNYAINRAQARDARLGGFRQALVSLVSALNQIESELRTEPRSKTAVRVINKQMTKFPQIDYITGRLHRRLFQPHLDALLVKLSDALAAIILVAPQELMAPLEAVSELMAQVDPASPDWWAAWQTARSALVVAARRALGEAGPPRQ